MKKTIYSTVALAGMALMGAQVALADVTLKYKITEKGQDVSQVIKYLDKQHIRVDIYEGRSLTATILRSGNKEYMINDGEVIDLEQMKAMSAQLGGMFGGGHTASPAHVTFERTGRKERVAGIPGEIYLVKGQGAAHEAVMARNPAIVEVMRAISELFKNAGTMGKSSANQMANMVDKKLKGMVMLRDAHSYELESMDKGKIQASVFNVSQIKASGGSRSSHRRAEGSRDSSGMPDMGSLLNGIFGK